jgi:hypothetical protein
LEAQGPAQDEVGKIRKLRRGQDGHSCRLEVRKGRMKEIAAPPEYQLEMSNRRFHQAMTKLKKGMQQYRFQTSRPDGVLDVVRNSNASEFFVLCPCGVLSQWRNNEA